MTVDSTYKPESCPNLRQTLYSSQFENDGPDVFKVVKVSGNGDRLVLDRGYHYQIVEPEVQTPYNYRCDIVLAAPLAEDAHLEVFRKTPIETEFNPQPLKRFDATTLEYEVDIITFIQQEIEGHVCACPIYPPYVGEPEIPDLAPPNPAPECQLYSCNSFVTKAIEDGYPASEFREVDALVVPASFDGYGGSGGPVFTIAQAGRVGDPMLFDSQEQYYAWPINGAIDACDGVVYGLGLGDTSAVISQGTKLTTPAGNGVAIVTSGGMASTSNGDTVFITQMSWRTFYYNNEFPPNNYLDYNGDYGVGYKNGEGFYLFPDSGGPYSGVPDWQDINLVTISISIRGTTHREYLPGSGNYQLVGYVTADIKVNGVDFTVSRFTELSINRPTPPTMSGITYGTGRMFGGMKTKLFAGILTSHEPTQEELDNITLWYEQNFTDYQPPEYCTPTGE